MEANRKHVIEQYIFNGSPDEFKQRIIEPDTYKFFKEIADRNPETIDFWEPSISCKLPVGGFGIGYEWKLIPISENRCELAVRIFNSNNSWNNIKFDLGQQGLIEPINEVDTIEFQLMPRNESTCKLYRRAWKLWLIMITEYEYDVIDARTKKSKPSMEDFRARVISELDWQVSTRTLSSVKRLGKMEFLA